MTQKEIHLYFHYWYICGYIVLCSKKGGHSDCFYYRQPFPAAYNRWKIVRAISDKAIDYTRGLLNFVDCNTHCNF